MVRDRNDNETQHMVNVIIQHDIYKEITAETLGTAGRMSSFWICSPAVYFRSVNIVPMRERAVDYKDKNRLRF